MLDLAKNKPLDQIHKYWQYCGQRLISWARFVKLSYFHQKNKE